MNSDLINEPYDYIDSDAINEAYHHFMISDWFDNADLWFCSLLRKAFTAGWRSAMAELNKRDPSFDCRNYFKD